MSLSGPKAELIGTCMEMIGYGVYFVIFIDGVRVLYRRYTSGKGCLYLTVVALVIFALVTSHFIIDLVHIMIAFTSNMETPNAPATYYSTIISSPLNITKNALYCTVTLISDGLIVYRLFVVWGYNYYITIFPLLTLFGELGTSVWLVQTIHQVIPGNKVMIAHITIPSRYFYILTLVLNLFCTFGVSFKIWVVQRDVSRYTLSPTSHLQRVMSVMAESVAIYFVWAIALMMANVYSPPVINLLLDAICPIIGIACSSVIVRVLKDRSAGSSASAMEADSFRLADKSCAKCSREDLIRRNKDTGGRATEFESQISSSYDHDFV